jgi:predicted ATPase
MSDIEHLPGAKVTGTMVRRLARHLQGVHKLTLKHTQAVDAVAAQLGFPNRHELANAQGRTLSQTGTPGLRRAPRTARR